MLRKFTALGAAATLVAGAFTGAAAPAQAAATNVYTQCTDHDTSKKLTKKTLGTVKEVACTDFAELGQLKNAQRLTSLTLESEKKLKVTGTDKLRTLGITGLAVDAPVADASFFFLKGIPKVAELSTGPTPVSTFANIGKFKNLQWVDVSTRKAMS